MDSEYIEVSLLVETMFALAGSGGYCQLKIVVNIFFYVDHTEMDEKGRTVTDKKIVACYAYLG